MRVSLPLTILFFLAAACFQVKAQSPRIDSLQRLLATDLTDTARIKVLYDIAWTYSRMHKDSALMYTDSALALATLKAYKPGITQANYSLGVIYLNDGDYPQALKYLEAAEQQYREAGDQRRQADALYQIGIVFFDQGKFEQSLTQLLAALKRYEAVGNLSGKGFTLNSIGILHRKMQQYDIALENYQQATAIFRELGDLSSVADGLVNMGNIEAERRHFDAAQDYYQQALAIDLELQYDWGIAYDYESLGSIFAHKEDFQRAIDYHHHALAIRKRLGQRREIAISHLRIGEVCVKMKAFGAAIEQLNQGLALSAELGLSSEVQEAYHQLSLAYAGQGLFQKAFDYQIKHNELKDSLWNAQTRQQLTELKTQYETERKDAMITQLREIRASEQERRVAERKAFLAGSGFLVLLVFSLGYFFINRQRHRERSRQIAMARERNERLRQIDHLKDQFLANTSHELRTPLQGIIGLSESLLEHTNNPEHREDLSMIIASGRRLNSLVNDILDYSKLKNYDIRLKRQPLALRPLTDIILRNNAPLVRGKLLQLINLVPADLPPLDADENRLQQVLFNLVGNAIKFTEEGFIKVGAHLAGKDVEIFVEDTGIGIPEDKWEIIFKEFEQADGSIRREFIGNGLGLSISRRFVELHGGKMWLDSTPGKGSTFFFTIPVSQEPFTEQEASHYPQPSLHASSIIPEEEEEAELALPVVEHRSDRHDETDQLNILVVDDEAINQRVFRSYLADGAFRITSAMNGEEALAMIDSGRVFDLVILDVMMPRLSGYEVCQRIREKFLPSELPVVMVTAKNQNQDLVQGLGTGANDYLVKPFSRDEFLARIKNQLDMNRIHQVTSRFVPNEFLRAIGRQRITDVRLGDHRECRMTVLFSDIRDYTTLSEKMTPAENFSFVNSLNGRLGPIIDQHQGFVNQYLGDGIMAIFPDCPDDALETAIDMQKELQRYNQSRRRKGRQPIRLGIGMDTGNLIMGIIGDQKRMDAATISDTTNTASRIESLSKYYGTGIMLSEDSLSQLKNPRDFHYRYLGKVQMKGKNRVVGIYECFEGDTPRNFEKKRATLSYFEEGVSLYSDRQFAAAVKAFQQVLHLHPQDETARLFLQKATNLLTTGVPVNWNGIEMMEHK